MKYTRQRIKGMLDVLNKLYWKVEKPENMLAEVNDTIELNGSFVFNGEAVIYVRR